MDVEEIKDKEKRLRKGYDHERDLTYTSAHIKAARRIMNGLKILRAQKQQRQYSMLEVSERKQNMSRMGESAKKELQGGRKRDTLSLMDDLSMHNT